MMLSSKASLTNEGAQNFQRAFLLRLRHPAYHPITYLRGEEYRPGVLLSTQEHYLTSERFRSP